MKSAYNLKWYQMFEYDIGLCEALIRSENFTRVCVNVL